MGAERRQYLRVLFEETIEIKTEEWTDSETSGLDISLAGLRFHCGHSMNDGDIIDIHFDSELILKGRVCWCWPIEWYYQSAVQLIDLSEEDQIAMRNYIMEVTGEDYPDYLENPPAPLPEHEHSGGDDDDMDGIDEGDLDFGDDDDNDNAFAIDDLDSQLEEADDEDDEGSSLLSPTAHKGKKVIVFGCEKEHESLLTQYLQERNGLDVTSLNKVNNLWPLLKSNSVDMLCLSWNAEDTSESLSLLEEVHDQFPEIMIFFISGPVSLEERLNALNAGAVDFITRPVHLSAISQSILLQLQHKSMFSDQGLDVTEDLGLSENILDSDDFLDEDELDLSDELELLDDDDF